MESLRKRRLMGEINVVPYIDVMLVLLIIFMVTAPLLSQGIKVELPELNSPATTRQKVESKNKGEEEESLSSLLLLLLLNAKLPATCSCCNRSTSRVSSRDSCKMARSASPSKR